MKKKIIFSIIILLFGISIVFVYNFRYQVLNLFGIYDNNNLLSVSQLHTIGREVNDEREVKTFGFLIEKKNKDSKYTKYFLVPNYEHSLIDLKQQLSVIVEVMDIKNNFKFKIDEKCINRYVSIKGKIDFMHMFRTIKTDSIITIETDKKEHLCSLEE